MRIRPFISMTNTMCLETRADALVVAWPDERPLRRVPDDFGQRLQQLAPSFEEYLDDVRHASPDDVHVVVGDQVASPLFDKIIFVTGELTPVQALASGVERLARHDNCATVTLALELSGGVKASHDFARDIGASLRDVGDRPDNRIKLVNVPVGTISSITVLYDTFSRGSLDRVSR